MSAATRLFPGIASALHWHHEEPTMTEGPALPTDTMPCGMTCGECPMATQCHGPEPIDVDPEEAAAYFAGEIPEAASFVASLHHPTPEAPRIVSTPAQDDGEAALARERAAIQAEEDERLRRQRSGAPDILAALEESINAARAARRG